MKRLLLPAIVALGGGPLADASAQAHAGHARHAPTSPVAHTASVPDAPAQATRHVRAAEAGPATAGPEPASACDASDPHACHAPAATADDAAQASDMTPERTTGTAADASPPAPGAGTERDDAARDAHHDHHAHGAAGSHGGHAPAPADASNTHATHGSHGRADGDLPADAAPRTPFPTITSADRAAAFPILRHRHAAHDRAVHAYVLADRFEWQEADAPTAAWEGLAWVGGDLHRLWLRTEGEVEQGEIDHAHLEALYGRSVTPWWDVVGGVRHDAGDGPSRTWAAIGVQGLAPYKFEVDATLYLGDGGRSMAVLGAEYETLLTGRLVLQWQAEAALHGADDAARGVASGLSTLEAGARLRFEVTRRFAPYVGLHWERAVGGTADLRRSAGEGAEDTRLVAGVRFWF